MSEYPWRAPRIVAWRWVSLAFSVIALIILTAYAWVRPEMPRLALASSICNVLAALT